MRQVAARAGAHRNPIHVRSGRSALLGVATVLLASSRALAQGTPPTAGYPPPAPAPAPPAPAPAPATPPAAAPAAAPPPAPAPAPAYGAPPPGDYTPPPNDYTPPPNDREMRPPPRGDPIEEPPPPPLPPPERKSPIPPFSVRIDPFTWIIEGHLQLELEVAVMKWLSVEVVPSFVTDTTPPVLSGYGTSGDLVREESNGWGPLSGGTLDAGFWLSGKALHGYVLRAMFTTNGYRYKSPVDEFVHTERWLMAMIGSNSTFGAFTIAGGFGLGYDLNNESRCIAGRTEATTSGCSELQLGLSRDPLDRYNSYGVVSSWIYPAVMAIRISLGITID